MKNMSIGDIVWHPTRRISFGAVHDLHGYDLGEYFEPCVR